MATGTWKITPDVEKYDVAVEWFLKRTVITGAAARRLDDRLKTEAFWVGNGLQLSQVQRVFDAITKAIEKGTPLDEFKRRMKATLKDQAHAETVFRNATQRAYNAARWDQMNEPSVKRFRPYGLFDAILDGRTTPICKVCDKVLLPLDDPWWQTHLPPLHHRCRSSVRNLRRTEADKRSRPPVPSELPPPGWGNVPSQSQPWKPDTSKTDPGLAKTLRKKAANDNAGKKRKSGKIVEPKKKAPAKKQPKPKTPPHHDPKHWEKDYRSIGYGDSAKSLGHGRAAMERGLDMTAKQVLDAFDDWIAFSKFPLRQRVAELDENRTLREQAGELTPELKAAAAIAGHVSAIKALKPREPLKNRDGGNIEDVPELARRFFQKATGPKVAHPEDYTFTYQEGRGYTFADKKLLVWSDRPGLLEHEWAHTLESHNPELARRAADFLVSRTRGEQLRKLSEVTGDSVYGANEVTRKDGFVHPYIGKEYVDRKGNRYGTEVTSVGVEILSSGNAVGTTIAEFVKKDQDHFLFTLGQLRGEE